MKILVLHGPNLNLLGTREPLFEQRLKHFRHLLCGGGFEVKLFQFEG